MFKKTLLLASVMTLLQGGAVFAEAGKPDSNSVAQPKAQTTTTEVEQVKAMDESVEGQVETKEKEVLLDRVVQMTSKLDKGQASHFFVMYSNYSIISLVNNVEKDVGEAVQKCGETNKDLKGKYDARFETWKSAISGARQEARKNIDSMVAAQDYATKAEMDEIFGMIDKTRLEADTRFQRIPVSTPEACEFMLTKMDETEKTMDQLLRATLASYPNVLKKNQE